MTEPIAMTEDEGIRLTPEQRRQQRGRSLAIAVTLAVLVGLFYLLTIAKLGGGVLAEKILGSM